MIKRWKDRKNKRRQQGRKTKGSKEKENIFVLLDYSNSQCSNLLCPNSNSKSTHPVLQISTCTYVVNGIGTMGARKKCCMCNIIICEVMEYIGMNNSIWLPPMCLQNFRIHVMFLFHIYVPSSTVSQWR